MKLTTLAISATGAVLAGLAAMSLALIVGNGEVDDLIAEAAEQQDELQLMLDLTTRSSKLLREVLEVAVFDATPEAPDPDKNAGSAGAAGSDAGSDAGEGKFFAELADSARRLRAEALDLLEHPPATLAERLGRADALQRLFETSVLSRLDAGIADEQGDAAATLALQHEALVQLHHVSVAAPIGLFLVLALALGLWIPRFIRRMRRLEAAARRIGAGTAEAAIDIAGRDELTDLALALNRMSDDLRRASQFLRDVYKTMPGGLIIVDADGMIEAVNDETLKLLMYSEGELVGKPIAIVFAPNEVPDFTFLDAGSDSGAVARTENVCRTKDDTLVPVLFSATRLPPNDAKAGPSGVVCIALDIRDRKKLELELRQAQKLESVGRLAAGVAHEINTPIQFVSDSVTFVKEAAKDITQLLTNYRDMKVAIQGGATADSLFAAAAENDEALDLDYLLSNVPLALARASDGLDRITTIVRSMKEFAHPHRQQMTTVDINRAILTTLTIARSEYKMVADVETDLGDVPPLKCFAGEMNQAILNLVVNAAHAIGDTIAKTGKKGLIKVTTRMEGDKLVIAIADDGSGIPLAVRDRIFDPFFTTKEIGRGTGQGLAIVHSVICQQHQGRVDFATGFGKGTTFYLRVPIAGVAYPRAA